MLSINDPGGGFLRKKKMLFSPYSPLPLWSNWSTRIKPTTVILFYSKCVNGSNQKVALGVNLLLSLRKTPAFVWLRMHFKIIWVWFCVLNFCFKKCKKKQSGSVLCISIFKENYLPFLLRERNENMEFWEVSMIVILYYRWPLDYLRPPKYL